MAFNFSLSPTKGFTQKQVLNTEELSSSAKPSSVSQSQCVPLRCTEKPSDQSQAIDKVGKEEDGYKTQSTQEYSQNSSQASRKEAPETFQGYQHDFLEKAQFDPTNDAYPLN